MLSQWIEKNFSSKRFDSQNSRYETLKSPLLKNVPPTSLCGCHSALNACFYQFILTELLNINEFITEL